MGWYGDDGHMFWSGWIMMAGWMALLAAGIAAGIYALVRSRRSTAAPPGLDALHILDMRFARGEIDIEEYEQRRTILTGRSSP